MDYKQAKEKVAKLMRLAKDTGATENEAERAMAQAESLMRKFSIQAAELLEDGLELKFSWCSEFTPYGNKYHQAKSLPAWYQYMAVGVAKFTDTIVKAHGNALSGMGVGFYGEKSDVAWAVWLTEYLRDNVQSEAAKHKDFSRSEREAFRVAMSCRLAKRMAELREGRSEAFRQGGGAALVVVDGKIAARDAEFGGTAYKQAKVRVTFITAAEAGREAANKVGLHRTVGKQTDKHCLAA